ncbi:MgtC/SapB family protein [Alicyclobacillus sp. TC]|uniref:MgtC/SapB family protein n=1 Tax=Alicyclobacillus sp. TC TaxID=2606450 RepID=UPI0019321D81|nr:MgtC/SapB family protein [Alicyclobacillus sp. TC]QRF23961.1 MgtC/SapB family protein [Alicyclobacillus sp. TC]
MFVFHWELYLRLVIALLFGFFVGLERARRGKTAGIRTHSLVALGSALVMVISSAQPNGPNKDMMRLAAQVVSGIGFLGAGVIWMDRQNVKRGLTTAANLWVTAAAGLAIGYGMYGVMLVTAFLIFVAVNSHDWAVRFNLIPKEAQKESDES